MANTYVLYARHCSRHFKHTNSFNVCSVPMKYSYYSCFTSEKTEAKDKVRTCLRSHSQGSDPNGQALTPCLNPCAICITSPKYNNGYEDLACPHE